MTTHRLPPLLTMSVLASEFLRLAGGGTVCVGVKELDGGNLQFFALGPSSRAVVVIPPSELRRDLDAFSATYLDPMVSRMGSMAGLLDDSREDLLRLGDSVAIATQA